MRNYDFSPLWRSTVGFDRVFELVNSVEFSETHDGYPPYISYERLTSAIAFRSRLWGFLPSTSPSRPSGSNA
jgi:hypothetical protein